MEKLNALKSMLVCESENLNTIDDYTFEDKTTLIHYYVVDFKEFKSHVLKDAYKWLYHFYLNRDLILEFQEDSILSNGKETLDNLLAQAPKEEANTLIALLMTTQGQNVRDFLEKHFNDDPREMKIHYFKENSSHIRFEVKNGDYLIFKF